MPMSLLITYPWPKPRTGLAELSQLNLLAPGKSEWNFIYVIFKWILEIDGWRISCEIHLIWMLFDFTDDQSRLVQVMAWCRQATSHYLSQCWPRSLMPYGVTRPQWEKKEHQAWELRCSAQHMPLHDGPGQVKLLVGQVDLGKVFFWIVCNLFWKMQNFESWGTKECYVEP